MPAQLTDTLAYPQCRYTTNAALVECIVEGWRVVDRANADRAAIRGLLK